VSVIVLGRFTDRYGVRSHVQSDGDVTFGVQGQTVLGWDDLQFPAASINPVGAISDPAIDVSETGLPGTLLFSGALDNMIAGIALMPHSWALGTQIHPHIHWMLPVASSAGVTWDFYYRHLGTPGDVMGAWIGPTVPVTAVGGDPTVQDANLITGFPFMDMVGKKEGTQFAWRLYRRGSTDANSGTARLLQLDFHYQKDKFGTYLEIPTGGA